MLSNTQVQTNLHFLGFYYGKINGNLKSLSCKSSIKSFQKSFELTRDGIWGVNSNRKCIEVVKDIQKKIGAKVDGIAGVETYDKCLKYQKSVGLKVDGIAGVQTRAKLNQSATLSWNDFKHFKRSEFACKDKCGFDNENLKVVKILEEIRSHFGDKPCIITSGCRCVKRNNKVGGIKGSKHLSGEACDFYIKGVSTQNLLNYTTKLMQQGKIKYTYTNNKNMKGVVHINI